MSPHDHRITVGTTFEATAAEVDRMVRAGHAAQVAWDALGGEKRAQLLERTADLYEEHAEEFFSLYPLDRIPEAKLHPSTGYRRHPWVEAYADFMRNEESFKTPEERLQAFAGYFGLVSFLDDNVGRIVRALRDTV